MLAADHIPDSSGQCSQLPATPLVRNYFSYLVQPIVSEREGVSIVMAAPYPGDWHFVVFLGERPVASFIKGSLVHT